MRIENILSEGFFKDAEDNWVKDEAGLTVSSYLDALQDSDKEYADAALLREIEHMKKHFTDEEFQQYLKFVKDGILAEIPDATLPF